MEKTAKHYTLGCQNFSDEEVAALRRLLTLLSSHLKDEWEIRLNAETDLCLANVDSGERVEPTPHVPMIGCALKPRLHGNASLHRPLRAAELLAVLSEYAEQRSGALPLHVAERAHAELGFETRFQLRAWPLEFPQWPTDWWRILASINRCPRSLADICANTGLCETEVERCLDLLQRMQLLDRLADRRVPMRGTVAVHSHPSRAWRSFAAKLGQMLGFAR